jgi:hypothetical protein
VRVTNYHTMMCHYIKIHDLIVCRLYYCRKEEHWIPKLCQFLYKEDFNESQR